jgi:Fe2+ transport system protein B
MGRYDEDEDIAEEATDEEAPKSSRTRRSADEDDEEEDIKALKANASRVLKRGWGNAEQVKTADSPYAQNLKLGEEEVVVKFLEDDPYVIGEINRQSPEAVHWVRNSQKILAQSHGRPPETVISSERHALSVNIFELVAVVKPAGKPGWRERLDTIATDRFWGYALLAAVLTAFFQVVFRFGQFTEVPVPTWVRKVSLMALRCWVKTKVVPDESERRTTRTGRSGNVTPGLVAAMRGSFQRSTWPAKISGYTSRERRSSGTPGRL